MSLSMKQKENISYPVNQFIDDMVKFIHLQLYIFKLKQQYYLIIHHIKSKIDPSS